MSEEIERGAVAREIVAKFLTTDPRRGLERAIESALEEKDSKIAELEAEVKRLIESRRNDAKVQSETHSWALDSDEKVLRLEAINRELVGALKKIQYGCTCLEPFNVGSITLKIMREECDKSLATHTPSMKVWEAERAVIEAVIKQESKLYFSGEVLNALEALENAKKEAEGR